MNRLSENSTTALTRKKVPVLMINTEANKQYRVKDKKMQHRTLTN